jgi:hypothetical protein
VSGMSDAGAQDVLPDAYRILPVSVPFRVPGFESHYHHGERVLAPAVIRPEEWFQDFVARLEAALGQQYLPICRMSDGEFRFAVGDQPPDLRSSAVIRRSWRLRRLVRQLVRGREFRAATRPGVSSGHFSADEWSEAHASYGALMGAIASQGILAMHLSYGSIAPFQEHYFPALARWLGANGIEITMQNYVPFYFVYAAFAGPSRHRLLKGRRLLLVHSARGAKRAAIEQRLRSEGVAAVHWCTISSERSFYDRIDVGSHVGAVDLALVGAGIGKPKILLQLASLNVPAVDAGYLFEIWADSDSKWDRPFCVPDDEWEEHRVRFAPAGWRTL